jgi:hypothetical protein
MSQPRETQAPAPEPIPDAPNESESSPEPLFSGTLAPDTTSHPSIKNN